ncbi:UV DNA damage repair endonuclease UvsE [Evansella sp. AB-P1]|uniref:UV DNA damage repair endonuclease UvsE n=1 Tax=Evansella sp. AB-P1 TaxID=3037653 RepID=UPI00241D394A|nr:UV DNA damage repair endonuclease UvsE [Evansella sp. AB-P1]MDG5789584.1 UV DNA damage repair endonuclease UvsE [Evansella sp. AB-P1]
MTIVRMGYVAMSMELKNSSPSQTMTFSQFNMINNKDAAIRKLERLAESNLENCYRLLKHNLAHDIHFFRLSSKLIPLATHEELKEWNYLAPIKPVLKKIGNFIKKHNMRIDFHPDHFVILNSSKQEIFLNSLKMLRLHRQLLKGMNMDITHRCVMHVGGSYKDKDTALERFIDNWSFVPEEIQRMIMLENDDKSFHSKDVLYLCEKLGIPLVFDYHHHLVNHEREEWREDWERIVNTWSFSPFPIKMHISSPKNDKEFRHHADFIQLEMFLQFLNEIKGSVPQIDCMIEAKQKDRALFKLMHDLKFRSEIEIIDGASFKII